MLIKEYRICLPLTVEEYRIAQLYMIQKKSRVESTDRGSGVEIIKNEPYEDGPGGSGQYTYKIFHVARHIPKWLRAILPSSALRVEEEAWNAYPYTRTIYKVPSFTGFILDIETRYFDDWGQRDNVFDLTGQEKSDRVVDFIDIVKDNLGHETLDEKDDPRRYVSRQTGRGPLSEDWRQDYIDASSSATGGDRFNGTAKATVDQLASSLPFQSVMCAYKLCRVTFNYWGIQRRAENFIHDYALRKTMVGAHLQVWTWQDEWYGLTLDDVRRLEADTAAYLSTKMAQTDSSNSSLCGGGSSDQILGADELAGGSEPTRTTSPESQSKLSLTNESNYSVDCMSEDSMTYISCTSRSRSESLTGPAPCQGINPMTNRELTSALLSDNPLKKLALIIVVHGGSLSEESSVELQKSQRQFDQRTAELSSKLKHVTSHSFPMLANRVAVRSTTSACASSPLLAQCVELLNRIRSYGPSFTKVDSHFNVVLPFLLFNSPNFKQILRQCAASINQCYADFIDSTEGFDFSGPVWLVADSLGGLACHSLLESSLPFASCFTSAHDRRRHSSSSTSSQFNDKSTPSHTSVSKGNGDQSTPRHAANNVVSTAESSNYFDSGENDNNQSSSESLLDFQVHSLLLLGSPVGCMLAQLQANLRADDKLNQPNANASSSSEASNGSDQRHHCCQLYNVFRLNDPLSCRIEPLLDASLVRLKPVELSTFNYWSLSYNSLIQFPASSSSNHRVDSANNSGDLKQLTVDVTSPVDDHDNTHIPSSTGCHPPVATASSDWKRHFNRIDYLVHDVTTMTQPQPFLLNDADMQLHSVGTIPSSRKSITNSNSYWTCDDLIYFILRQLLNDVGLDPGDLSSDSFANRANHPSRPTRNINGSGFLDNSPVTSSGGWLHSTTSSFANNTVIDPVSSSLITPVDDLSVDSSTNSKPSPRIPFQSMKPNHRGSDVLCLESDQPQTITTRFVFGIFDIVSLSNEKITAQLHLADGSQFELPSQGLTDSSGRYSLQLPSNLPKGLHSARLTAASDPHHPVFLQLAIVQPSTKVVVFSIDGSFTASFSLMGKDPKVHPGVVDVARHWYSLGYLLIYLSARPLMQRRRVTSWMAKHNFPRGIALFNEGIATDPLRQKTQLLTNAVNRVSIKLLEQLHWMSQKSRLRRAPTRLSAAKDFCTNLPQIGVNSCIV